MANQIKQPIYKYTAPLGESIECEFRNMFGIKFITVRCNFSVIEHILFASAYIASIEGIRGINSVVNDKKGGTFYLGLNKSYDPDVIILSIENEFKNYFSTLDKNPLSV